MKRAIALFLSLVLCLAGTISFASDGGVVMFDMGDETTEGADATAEVPAEAPPEGDLPEEELLEEEEPPFVYEGDFVIGATTRLNGMFFTNMWGNNTSDIDVRSLLHGYSPVVWTMQSRFEIDPQVVVSLTTGFYEDGNKFYGIQLAEDLVYNDGTPITAHDYVFSLMLFASPVIAELGGITTNSGYIAGSDEYRDGTSEYFSGLHIVDDHSFTIEIKAEYLPFFFELGMLDCIPYPISIIAPGCEVASDPEQGAYIRNIDETVEEPLFNAENLAETILDPETGYLSHPWVTCGPYMLDDFDWETREARFKLNPNYKGNYEGVIPTIDDLVLKTVTPENMLEEFEEGEVQLLNKVVAKENILAALELETAKPYNYPRMGLGFINYACEQGPMQFEAVRKAVAYAIDAETFRWEYLDNFGAATYGYYGLGQWMVAGVEGRSIPEALTDEEAVLWEEMVISLEEYLETYDQDLEKAKQLLIDDGWILNENGLPFVEGQDTTRYKMVDGALMGLHLQYGKMEDSIAAQMLDEMMLEPLAAIGITYDATEVPFIDLLQHYYRQVDRTYDIMYLATNFISIFDPYFVFNTDDAYQGTQNTTGFRDQQLEDLAKDLRETEPGDLFTYVQKWLAFQKYWNEKLPMYPLYSNMYFDFSILELNNYMPDAEMNWPVAILYAYLGDVKPQWLIDKEEAEAAEALAEMEAGGEGEALVTIED